MSTRVAGPPSRTLPPGWAAAPAMTVAACVVGGLLATDRAEVAVLVVVAPLVAYGGVLACPAIARLLELGGSRVVGLAWLLLIASTFVWRQRTTQSLVSEPLDSAAVVRVGLVAAAALLLLVHLVRASVGERLPASVKLLGAYTAIAFASAVASPLPLFAAYRAIELTVGLAAIVAAATVGRSQWQRPLELIVACLGAIVTVAWIEAVALPHLAWESHSGALAPSLVGAIPSFSSNTLGQFGAFLGIWGIAHAGTRAYPRRVLLFATFAGVATLLATQYRTGVIGFLLALTAVAWQRRRTAFTAAVLAGVLLIVASGEWKSLRQETEVLFARGNPGAVQTLDSRTIFWRASLPYVEERPLLGWGLNVGTREVLSGLGRDLTSTIHSTWFEALLGTGVVGVALLALAFAALLASALARKRDALRAALVGIAIVLLVRSLTGGTIELFDPDVLLFGALALAVRAPVRVAAPDPLPPRRGSASCAAHRATPG